MKKVELYNKENISGCSISKSDKEGNKVTTRGLC